MVGDVVERGTPGPPHRPFLVFVRANQDERVAGASRGYIKQSQFLPQQLGPSLLGSQPMREAWIVISAVGRGNTRTQPVFLIQEDT